jgi:hypothetical protein
MAPHPTKPVRPEGLRHEGQLTKLHADEMPGRGSCTASAPKLMRKACFHLNAGPTSAVNPSHRLVGNDAGPPKTWRKNEREMGGKHQENTKRIRTKHEANTKATH